MELTQWRHPLFFDERDPIRYLTRFITTLDYIFDSLLKYKPLHPLFSLLIRLSIDANLLHLCLPDQIEQMVRLLTLLYAINRLFVLDLCPR